MLPKRRVPVAELQRDSQGALSGPPLPQARSLEGKAPWGPSLGARRAQPARRAGALTLCPRRQKKEEGGPSCPPRSPCPSMWAQEGQSRHCPAPGSRPSTQCLRSPPPSPPPDLGPGKKVQQQGWGGDGSTTSRGLWPHQFFPQCREGTAQGSPRRTLGK